MKKNNYCEAYYQNNNGRFESDVNTFESIELMISALLFDMYFVAWIS